MDAVGINIGGLKCDTPTCDYNDPTVKYEDYPSMIDAPCPKCGASLLTKEDYETTQQMIEFVKNMNAILPPADPNEQKVAVPIELDGSGKIKINLEEMKNVERDDD